MIVSRGWNPGGGVVTTLRALFWLATALAPCIPSARAQSIALHYDAPDGCPDEPWFRAEVMGRLGRDPFVSGEREEDGEIHLAVHISRDEGGLVAEIEAEEGGAALGRRSVRGDGEDCRELASTVALTVVVVLESVSPAEAEPGTDGAPPPHDASPDGGGDAGPVEERATDRTESSTTAGGDTSTHASWTSPAPRSAEARERAPALRLGFGADVGISAAAQPGPALAVGVGLALRLDDFVARVQVRGFTDSSAASGGLTADTRWLEVAASPCARWDWLEACGVVALGRLEAHGDRLANPRDAEAWVPSVGTSLRAELGLTEWFAVGVRTEFGVPLTHPRIVAADSVLWEAPPVRGLVSLGVTLLFPVGSGTDPAPSSQASSNRHAPR